jgi:hypothetical protein
MALVAAAMANSSSAGDDVGTTSWALVLNMVPTLRR